MPGAPERLVVVVVVAAAAAAAAAAVVVVVVMEEIVLEAGRPLAAAKRRNCSPGLACKSLHCASPSSTFWAQTMSLSATWVGTD